MKLCKSKHTVNIYDCIELNDFQYDIIEYCNGGDLKTEILKRRSIRSAFSERVKSISSSIGCHEILLSIIERFKRHS